MKTSKTPYEIRLDLLTLARDILVEQHHARAGKTAFDSTSKEVYVTTAPTTDEVIAEAEKLNTFISKAQHQ